MPKEDLGQILVGQLRSGELYALPASYYDFDLAVPESVAKRCAAGDASCSHMIAPVSLRQPFSSNVSSLIGWCLISGRPTGFCKGLKRA